MSVHRLVKSCLSEDGKLYMFVSSLTQTNKKVGHFLVYHRDTCMYVWYHHLNGTCTCAHVYYVCTYIINMYACKRVCSFCIGVCMLPVGTFVSAEGLRTLHVYMTFQAH